MLDGTISIMSRPIALLTDFGTVDTYVGVMKGVILSICPDAPIIDLTHAIQPQNIRQAAFRLLNSYAYFPKGTIFVIVVDPGVGSARHPIAVEAKGYTFVAPDNGILSYVLLELGGGQPVTLENAAYQLGSVSYSFHGRDIFAPAAAHLAKGVPLEDFGAQPERLVALNAPVLDAEDTAIRGEVLDVDHFGNVITSIGHLFWNRADQLTLRPRFGARNLVVTLPAATSTIQIAGQQVRGIKKTYSETARGDLLAMIGSSGYLEIAVNHGSAAERLRVSPDDRVDINIR
jgi:S-adenosyl-L-methionine hydrolase (adenosine-forming)